MKKELVWKKLDSSVPYENPWIRFRVDKTISPHGQPYDYGFLDNRDVTVIIAQDKDGLIALLEEFRYPAQATLFNFPAGRVEEGMSALDSAKKELLEEAGIKAREWKKIGAFFVYPSCEKAKFHIFLAKGLDKSGMGTTKQEGNESILGVSFVSRATLEKMAKTNQIECGPTLASIQLFFSKS